MLCKNGITDACSTADCLVNLEEATDEEATDEEATDEEATDEEATDEDCHILPLTGFNAQKWMDSGMAL